MQLHAGPIRPQLEVGTATGRAGTAPGMVDAATDEAMDSFSVLHRFEGAQRPVPADLNSLLSIPISLSGVGRVDACSSTVAPLHTLHWPKHGVTSGQLDCRTSFASELKSLSLQRLTGVRGDQRISEGIRMHQ